ncbi:MAG: formimidoylglutamate deiminase [Acidimicrobiales bacterium]
MTLGPRRSWHAELAWTGTPSLIPDERVLIETEGDRITSVTPGADPPTDAVRLAGLTLPGLANGHSHAFHRALRGRTHGGNGDFWTWREVMYKVAGRLDPESYHDLALATYAEMALAGITVVGEFHYLHHDRGGARYRDPNAMGRALVEAATGAGLRITLIDTCYLQGGFGQPLAGPQLRFGDGDVEAWAARAAALDGAVTESRSNCRVGAAIHSVRAVSPADLAGVVAWAGERAAPLHFHLSEQPAENQACLAATGRTPTALLAGEGALGPTSTAVHATHLTDDDVDLLGASRTCVCLCPTTERDLADGIGPGLRLAGAGSPLSLGSDSQAVIDLFEEARAVELDERLATGRRGRHRAPDLLAAATSTGSASLGWPEAGRIVPGALADMVTVGLGSPRLAGTEPARAVEAAVFAATGSDVTDVVVGGRHVVAGGRHLLVPDVAAKLDRAIRRLHDQP